MIGCTSLGACMRRAPGEAQGVCILVSDTTVNNEDFLLFPKIGAPLGRLRGRRSGGGAGRLRGARLAREAEVQAVAHRPGCVPQRRIRRVRRHRRLLQPAGSSAKKASDDRTLQPKNSPLTPFWL